MERSDGPYRTPTLRRPDAPLPASPTLISRLASSAVKVLLLALIVTCCIPSVSLVAAACAGLFVALMSIGVAFGVHGLWPRNGRSIRRSVGCFAAAAVAANVWVNARCAPAREQQIIAAVHVWRAEHGRYPRALSELSLDPPADGSSRSA